MATTPEQINLWIKSRTEHQRLEFKEAKAQFDNHKLYEYCVALANEGGGILLLGITNEHPRKVVGTQAFNDPVKMAEKLFQAIGFRVDIEEVQHSNGRVLVFHIPARPRGTAYHLEGKYLMRSGSSLRPMSEDQLRRIFAEGEPSWLEEYSQTKLDSQRVVELLDTQTFFELLKLPYPTERKGVIGRLLQEQLIDETDGTYSIRRLGALLLAKRLEEFPDLSRKAPRVVVYSGSSKLDTRLDQMNREDRVRACYQHAALKWVMSERMTNQSLRQRFHLPETKSTIVSQVISMAIEANLIKPDEKAGSSRKYACYLPFWA